MGDLLKDLLKEIDNDYAGVADDGVIAGDVTGFVSTGSYSLNALVSGSMYGGIPKNRVTAFAGEPSTGKTFYTLSVVKEFLKENPGGIVFYFESESAISKSLLEGRGINTLRVVVVPVATVQEFRTQAVKILNKVIGNKDKTPIMMCLDSLGNLSTDKEMSDISDGKDTRDMTRAQLIKAAFRVLTLKLGKANIPLIITNHVYDAVGSYIPTKRMSGGSGLEYAASTIIFLTKKKDKDKDNQVIGSIVTAVLNKARLTIEKKKVETLLDFKKGLDPYYGLLDLAEKFEIVKKVSTKLEFPDGTSDFKSTILKNPQKYFTQEIMEDLEKKCKDEFVYGTSNVADAEVENNGE